MVNEYYACIERATAYELWIPDGTGFPVDYAAVSEHKNEHVFMCVSDGLLLLFASLNTHLDLYIHFHWSIVRTYDGVFCSSESFCCAKGGI